MDLISVILSVYNGRNTIERCIDSVLASKTKYDSFAFDFELIIVDDGSTDESWNILQDYQKSNNHIRVFRQENQGVASARNNALQRVKGNYIAFCDADDWVEPDWLLSMYISLISTNADLVKYRAIIDGKNSTFNPQETITWNRHEVKLAFLEHRLMNGILWSCLFTKKCFDARVFDTSLSSYSDSDFMWNVLQSVNRVVRVNDAKYHYIINGDSLSNGRMTEKKVRSAIILWDKIVESIPEIDSEMKDLARVTRIKWFNSSLMGMFRCGLKNRLLEKRIQKELQNSIALSLQSQTSLSGKIGIIITIMSIRVSRFLYMSFNKLSN